MNIEKLILKFIRKSKRPRKDKTLMKKKNKLEGSSLPGVNSYCKVTLIKTV